MATEKFSNNATTNLTNPIGSGDASFDVNAVTNFPTTGNFRIRIDDEIMLVTAVTGLTFSVTRGQETTSAVSHSAGTLVREVLTAGAVDRLRADTIQTGTRAARPTNEKEGILYLTNNSFYLYRDTGSAWVAHGTILKLTEPIDSDFAWVNQGTATVSTTNGGVFLRGATYGAGESINIRKKTLSPTIGYQTGIGFVPHLNPSSNGSTHCGHVLRDSASGKFIAFGIQQVNGSPATLVIKQYNSETSLNATLYDTQMNFRETIGLSVADNGSLRLYFIANDGFNGILVYVESRTTFITPDEYGFYVSNFTNSFSSTLANSGITTISFS